MVGMWVFGHIDAVVYRDEGDRRASNDQRVNLDDVHAFMVSVDQLLPVDVSGGSRWEPSGNEFSRA